MKTFPLIFIILFGLSLTNCSSGKKALEKGDYYSAVYQAVKRLRNNPDHKKSRSTLKDGYPLALEYYQNMITRQQNSTQKFKTASVVSYMQTINNMHDLIKRCPVCMKIVPDPFLYEAELNRAKELAAEEYYVEAEKMMQSGIRDDAKFAYTYYSKAEYYVPGYKDCKTKKIDAEWIATLKVVYEGRGTGRRLEKVDTDFFLDNIQAFLIDHFNSKQFLKLFLPVQIRQEGIQPDHRVQVTFSYFMLEPIVLDRNTVTVRSSDSVLITTKTINGQKVDIYDYVNAQLTTNSKTIIAKAQAELKILDGTNRQVLLHEKFPVEYTWVNEWGNYHGDKRALNANQLQLTENEELQKPKGQELFAECSNLLYTEITNSLTAFYAKY